MAIQFDIKKAYDTLDWSFLLDSLLTFGFSPKFMLWIHHILLSARMSININSALHVFLAVKKELDRVTHFLLCYFTLQKKF